MQWQLDGNRYIKLSGGKVEPVRDQPSRWEDGAEYLGMYVERAVSLVAAYIERGYVYQIPGTDRTIPPSPTENIDKSAFQSLHEYTEELIDIVMTVSNLAALPEEMKAELDAHIDIWEAMEGGDD